MYTDVYDRLIARNYDSVYAVLRDPSGDVAFYRDLARETGGPVLELGCGTGRTLLPIAREGIECVGLDASPEMLQVFREKAPPPNLTLVQGRMQDFDLEGRRFRLITAPFRAFLHLLTVPEQLAGLSRIRHHLAPGGLFVFDVFDPKLDRIAQVDEPETLVATFQHEGHEVRRYDSVHRDHTTPGAHPSPGDHGAPGSSQGVMNTVTGISIWAFPPSGGANRADETRFCIQLVTEEGSPLTAASWTDVTLPDASMLASSTIFAPVFTELRSPARDRLTQRRNPAPIP